MPDLSHLSFSLTLQVEAFYHGIKDVPALPARAAALSARVSFASRAEDAQRRVGILSAACAALAGSARLPRVVAAVSRIVSDMSGSGAAAGSAPRVTLLTLPTLKAVTDGASRTLLQHVVSSLLETDADAAALGADGEFAAVAAAAGGDAGLDCLASDVTTLARELASLEAAVVAKLVPGSDDASEATFSGAAALAPDAPLAHFLPAARAQLLALQDAHAAAKAAFAALLAVHGDLEPGSASLPNDGPKPDVVLRSLNADFLGEFARLRNSLAAKATAAKRGGSGSKWSSK